MVNVHSRLNEWSIFVYSYMKCILRTSYLSICGSSLPPTSSHNSKVDCACNIYSDSDTDDSVAVRGLEKDLFKVITN